MVAPTLWCGMAEHHMAFGGTFTFDIPTYRAVLLGFLKSIERHGFKRVFIVNGHGGNIAALNAFLPDFARETGLTLYATTYFELSKADLAQFLEDQKSVHHACEVETSMMMVVAPDTVKHDRLPEAFGHAQRRPAQGLSGVALRSVQGHLTRKRRDRRRAPRQRDRRARSCSPSAPKASPPR